MKKRFTDCEKWMKDAWFQGLSPKYKLFWLFLLDMCDNSGVWDPNLQFASLVIGMNYEADETLKIMKDKILVLNNGKWWIKNFIQFQYGEKLTEKSPPHKAVLNLIKKHRLPYPSARVKLGYPYPSATLQEKDKDKYIVQDNKNTTDESTSITKGNGDRLKALVKNLTMLWKRHYKIKFGSKYYDRPDELREISEFIRLNIDDITNDIHGLNVKMALFLFSDQVGLGKREDGTHRIAPTLSNFFKYLSRLPEKIDENRLAQLREAGYVV